MERIGRKLFLIISFEKLTNYFVAVDLGNWCETMVEHADAFFCKIWCLICQFLNQPFSPLNFNFASICKVTQTACARKQIGRKGSRNELEPLANWALKIEKKSAKNMFMLENCTHCSRAFPENQLKWVWAAESILQKLMQKRMSSVGFFWKLLK